MEHLSKFFALCKAVVLSLVAWALMLLWLPFLFIYRTTIDIILRIKHGKSYGGLFDMSDCIYLQPSATKCSMNSIFFIKSHCQINLFEVIRKVYQEKVFSNPCAYPKLTSSKHDFGGYPYWLKNDVTIADTIKSLQIPQDKVFTEEYLKELAGKISMRNFPKNEAVLWEMYVSEEALDNKNVSTCYRYPVIARVHHSICDGTSLIALLLRLFGDEFSQNYSEKLFKSLFKERSSESKSTREVIKMNLVKFIKTVRLWLELIFVALGRSMLDNQLKPPDQNALHKLPFSGEKIVAWVVEEYAECIPLIKKIRRKTNSKFMSVLCTAISASMTNYFKRNSYPIPDYTYGASSHLMNFPSIDPSKPIKLKNKVTVCIGKYPTNKKPNALVETLEKIDEMLKQETNYSNGLVARFFMAVVYGIIPAKFLRSVVGFNSHTFLITNIPGGSQINFVDGYVFENIIGVAPNFVGVGISFTLLSYDNRLQIGIMVDKVLTKSQTEVQQIADDILHYIKIMDTEVRKIYGE